MSRQVGGERWAKSTKCRLHMIMSFIACIWLRCLMSVFELDCSSVSKTYSVALCAVLLSAGGMSDQSRGTWKRPKYRFVVAAHSLNPVIARRIGSLSESMM